MAADDTIMAFTSARPFGRTLERLAVAIEAAGLTIFARIDHAAAAEAVGCTWPPTTVIIYGNARGGTPGDAGDAQCGARPAAAGCWCGRMPAARWWLRSIRWARCWRKRGSPALAARLAPGQQLLIGAMREGARE